MNINKDQVAAAIDAGLSLTDPSKDLLEVFRRHASGIILLRAVLTAIAQGEIVLEQGSRQSPEPESPKPDDDNG